MQRCVFRILGKRPLLMHNPAGMSHVDGAPSRKQVPLPAEEAERSAYRLPSGQLYLKGEAFRGSLLKAASGYRIAKTSAKTVFAAGVFILEEECPLVHPKTNKPLHDYVIDTRRAVVQGNGVLRSRARVNEWATTVNIEYDEEIVTPEIILRFFRRAGQFVGVGDQRPGAPKTPGQFGTYAVELVRDK